MAMTKTSLIAVGFAALLMACTLAGVAFYCNNSDGTSIDANSGTPVVAVADYTKVTADNGELIMSDISSMVETQNGVYLYTFRPITQMAYDQTFTASKAKATMVDEALTTELGSSLDSRANDLLAVMTTADNIVYDKAAKVLRVTDIDLASQYLRNCSDSYQAMILGSSDSYQAMILGSSDSYQAMILGSSDNLGTSVRSGYTAEDLIDLSSDYTIPAGTATVNVYMLVDDSMLCESAKKRATNDIDYSITALRFSVDLNEETYSAVADAKLIDSMILTVIPAYCASDVTVVAVYLLGNEPQKNAYFFVSTLIPYKNVNGFIPYVNDADVTDQYSVLSIQLPFAVDYHAEVAETLCIFSYVNVHGSALTFFDADWDDQYEVKAASLGM